MNEYNRSTRSTNGCETYLGHYSKPAHERVLLVASFQVDLEACEERKTIEEGDPVS